MLLLDWRNQVLRPFPSTTSICFLANASGATLLVFFAIADALFALFPLTFLWKLKITRRTKLALGFVLGLGFLYAIPLHAPHGH